MLTWGVVSTATENLESLFGGCQFLLVDPVWSEAKLQVGLFSWTDVRQAGSGRGLVEVGKIMASFPSSNAPTHNTHPCRELAKDQWFYYLVGLTRLFTTLICNKMSYHVLNNNNSS